MNHLLFEAEHAIGRTDLRTITANNGTSSCEVVCEAVATALPLLSIEEITCETDETSCHTAKRVCKDNVTEYLPTTEKDRMAEKPCSDRASAVVETPAAATSPFYAMCAGRVCEAEGDGASDSGAVGVLSAGNWQAIRQAKYIRAPHRESQSNNMAVAERSEGVGDPLKCPTAVAEHTAESSCAARPNEGGGEPSDARTPEATTVASPGKTSDASTISRGFLHIEDAVEGSSGLLYRAAKRAFDVASASALLVALSPLMLATGVAVKATSKGPVLFRQLRYGKNKRPFVCYKFRSMTVDTPDHVPTEVMQENPAAMTPIGSFLRKTSIDELPQLLNIIKGDIPLRILKTRPEFSEESMGAFALPAKISTNKEKAFSQVVSCFASDLRMRRISKFNCKRIGSVEGRFLAKLVFGAVGA